MMCRQAEGSAFGEHDQGVQRLHVGLCLGDGAGAVYRPLRPPWLHADPGKHGLPCSQPFAHHYTHGYMQIPEVSPWLYTGLTPKSHYVCFG